LGTSAGPAVVDVGGALDYPWTMASWSERLVTIPPGRHTLSTDFVTAHQRERIFAATAELVAKRGYHGTSIDLIAKTARVALSTFYENFASKEDCFLAAFDDAVAEARHHLGAVVDPQAPWPDRLASGLAAFLELVVPNRPKARMCLVEAPGGGPALLDRYESALDGLIPILREGRRLAGDRRLPERTEEAIIGGLAWVLYNHLVAGEFDLGALAPELLQIMLRPYLGSSEARRQAEIAQAGLA
jgi:AcrR family transcriptional regulator